MKKLNDNLSEIFDVEPLPEPEVLPALKETNEGSSSNLKATERDQQARRERFGSGLRALKVYTSLLLFSAAGAQKEKPAKSLT